MVQGQGKGRVECLFVGGPQGDETITLPGIYCRDRVSLVDNTWFAEATDGGATIMRGRRSKTAPWVTFYRHVLRKRSQDPGL